MMDRIADWLEDWGAWLFIIFAVCVVVFVGYMAAITDPDEVNQPCSYFKDYQMKDVPARCISYFQNQENK